MLDCNYLYQITNNATFAAIAGVILAAYLATTEYSKQKDIDRDTEIKKDIIDDLILLQEKSHYVLLIIDRIAHTYIKTDRSDRDFFENDIKLELPDFSNKVNDEIPALNIKIKSKMDIYFENIPIVQSQLEIFRLELKNWHEFVVHAKFNLRKRIHLQPELSLVKFDLELKRLIKLIWEYQLNHQDNIE